MITPGGRPGDASGLGKDPDGPRRLVNYIRMVAHALMRKGMSKGHAIATARNMMKRWATGKGVSPKVQAAAAKALVEQTALDKGRRVKKEDQSTWDMQAYADICAELDKAEIMALDDTFKYDVVEKRIRRVRTPEGAAFFGLPIGTPITRGAITHAKQRHGVNAVFNQLDHEGGMPRVAMHGVAPSARG